MTDLSLVYFPFYVAFYCDYIKTFFSYYIGKHLFYVSVPFYYKKFCNEHFCYVFPHVCM